MTSTSYNKAVSDYLTVALERKVWNCLVENGPMTRRRLSKLLHIQPSGVSKPVASLLDKEFIGVAYRGTDSATGYTVDYVQALPNDNDR